MWKKQLWPEEFVYSSDKAYKNDSTSHSQGNLPDFSGMTYESLQFHNNYISTSGNL